MRALLDVNVLIALLDSSHAHHSVATAWLRNNLEPGWASCPITQNGCIRILSQSAYPMSATPADVAQRLGDAVADPAHQFWPDDINLLDAGALQWDRLLSGRHLTDLYLLLIAVRHEARLVTFDGNIPLHIATGAQPHHLCVIETHIH